MGTIAFPVMEREWDMHVDAGRCRGCYHVCGVTLKMQPASMEESKRMLQKIEDSIAKVDIHYP
jgi:hypothetical protein